MALNKSVIETKPSARSAIELKEVFAEIGKILSKSSRKYSNVENNLIQGDMISLDKIASKTKKVNTTQDKETLEAKEALDVFVEKVKTRNKKKPKKPRFEIPENGRKNLETVSESLDLLGDMLKM